MCGAAPERLLGAYGAKIVGLTDTGCGIAQCGAAVRFHRAPLPGDFAAQ